LQPQFDCDMATPHPPHPPVIRTPQQPLSQLKETKIRAIPAASRLSRDDCKQTIVRVCKKSNDETIDREMVIVIPLR